jgi:hypothetical protein
MQVNIYKSRPDKELSDHRHSEKKIRKILVPVTANHESFSGLDMAFLISTQIPCEITLAYLLPEDKYHNVKSHHKDLIDLIENKVRPELNFAHKWNKYKESIRLLVSRIEDSKASKILQLADEGSFDFVAMWAERTKNHFLGPVFSEKPETLKIMKELDCPLICLSELPVESSIKIILLPISNASDVFLKLDKTAVLAAALKSQISLLLVLDEPSEEEQKEASKLLGLCEKYLRIRKISTSSKIISHHDQFETALAYGSIVRAGLISNGFCDKESFNSIGTEHLAKKIMLHSHLPTFNFYYKQI